MTIGPESDNLNQQKSKENFSDLVILFRGVRNSDANEKGSWWTEDAFYACSISGPDGDLFMMNVPKSVLEEYKKQGKMINQTYRELNENESEIEFPKELPLEPVKLTNNQKAAFTKNLKFTKLGATHAVKRLFSGSGLLKTREIAQGFFETNETPVKI